VRKGLNLNFITANISLSETRQAQLDGRDYLVAPVVMAVEGVMKELLYPADELGKFVEAWNGRPVTLFHPKNDDGFISANSPEVAASVHLGRLYHTRFEENALKSEIWTDIAKAKEVRPEVLEYMEGKRDRLEVSTGLWGDITPDRGTWNGKDYTGIMRNIRPDHLALLPGGEGACNWRDGCGVRANEEEGMKKDPLLLLYSNESMTDGELRQSLQKAVDALDNNEFVHYVEAIIPDENKVIYRADPRSTGGGMMASSGKMLRRGYTMDQNGSATLTGEPEEVRRKITYLKVQSEGENSMNKKQMIDALIKDPRTNWEEGCRETLNGFNEKQLEKMMPKDNLVLVNAKLPGATDHATLQAEADRVFTAATKPADDKPKKEEKPVIANASDQPKVSTPAEWLNAQKDMPTQFKAMFSNLLLNEEKAREDLIENITKSPKNKFSKEKLQAMETQDLRALRELVAEVETPAPQPNFGMRAPGGAQPETNAAAEPEPLVLNSLEDAFKEKMKK